VYTTSTQASSSNGSTTVGPAPQPYQPHILDAPSIVSLVLWFLVVLYSSFSSASKGEKLLSVGSGREKTSLTELERKKKKKTCRTIKKKAALF
jgi:hypothetical protein